MSEAGKRTEPGEMSEAGKRTEPGEMSEAGETGRTGQRTEPGNGQNRGKRYEKVSKKMDQRIAGGKYLLYSDGSTVEDLRRHTEKARNIRLMYEYIQENRAGNYEIPWSVWLEQEMLENAA